MNTEEQDRIDKWAEVYEYPPEAPAEYEDGLGAARGLWTSFRIVGGIILLVVWASRMVALMRDGAWEVMFLGSVFLFAGAAAFRYMEMHYPKNRRVAFGVSVICITLGLGFLA